jgi:N-acetylglucosaminyldiphosphoundecaprenol N-acetyl-beta-D-mannosaminyltransferase
VWASRLLGRGLPERVTGIDLMSALIADAARSRRRLYFLGARQEILDRVLQRVGRDHPSAIVAGARNGYWAADAEPDIARSIAEAAPDFLFVAIPSPAKERFLKRWKETMRVPFAMGVGGSFDVYAGAVPRAPRPFRVLGMEWFFRLLKEPRRMWRRYLVDDLLFIPIVLRELVRARTGRRSPTGGDAH